MAFIKKTRAYFYSTFGVNSRGKETGFKTDDQPNQERFEELMGSTPFFDEEDDRAKQDTGSVDFKDYVGLVAITSDAKAKANTSGLEADRTLVPHARQLPTVAATETDTVSDFSDVALAVSVDGSVTTRNNFLVRLSTNFKAWLADVRTDLNTAQSDITTVEGDITTLDGRVTATEGDITTIQGDVNTLETTVNTITTTTIPALETRIDDVELGGNLTVGDGTTTVTPVDTILFSDAYFDVVDAGGGNANIITTGLWQSFAGISVVVSSGSASLSTTIYQYTKLNSRTMLVNFDVTVTATTVGGAYLRIDPPTTPEVIQFNSITDRIVCYLNDSFGEQEYLIGYGDTASGNFIKINPTMATTLSTRTWRFVGQGIFNIVIV